MPIVFLKGTIEDEQSLGPVLNSGKVDIYAYRVGNPTDLIYLGGHQVNDAPEYNITEGKVSPTYKRRGSRHVVEDEMITPDTIKGVTMTILLPNRRFTAAQQLYKLQERGAKYNLLLVPSECLDECDKWWELMRSVTFGQPQKTNASVGWDENEGPINRSMTAKFQGNYQEFYGILPTRVLDQTEALYAVAVSKAGNCDNEFSCPNTNLLIGGAGTDNRLRQTQDGFLNLTSIVNTAIPADNVITDILEDSGYIIVTFADVANSSTATEGGIAVSINGAPLAAAGIVSVGLQAVLKAFGKYYAFGNNGEVWASCDANSWDAITSPITEDIIAAAYDRSTGLVYIATTTGGAWVFDGKVFNNISADVGAGTDDLLSVAVLGPNHVAFGDEAGTFYENKQANKFGAYSAHVFGADPIHAIMGDGDSLRTVIGHGNDVWVRDVFSIAAGRDWQQVYTATGVIMDIDRGEEVADEGVNYFIVVTDAGETIEFKSCYPCQSSAC